MSKKLVMLVLMVLAGIGLLGAGIAFGFWLVGVTGGPAGSGLVDNLVKGATPTVSVTSGTATANISFNTGTTQAGAAVISYSVARYDAYTGASSGSASGSCSIVSSTVGCTDTPGTGSWQYTETPLYGSNWSGPESSKSTAIFIAAATGLSPMNGTVGSSASVTAQGFAANSALTVTVGGVSASISAGGTTNSSGSSRVTFTIPALPKGAQSVTVTDGSANTASSANNFTVKSSLGVAPTTGIVGSTATLSGTGYTAGKTVATANVTFGSGTVAITTQTVAANGTWSASFTVPFAGNGTYSITAGDSGTDSAQATYTVTGSFTSLTFNQTSGTGTLSCNYSPPASVTCTTSNEGKNASMAGQVEFVNGTPGSTVTNTSGSAINVSATQTGGNGTFTPSSGSIANNSATSGTFTLSSNNHNTWTTTVQFSVTVRGIAYSVTVTATGN